MSPSRSHCQMNSLPLDLNQKTRLTDSQKAALERIETEDFPFVWERLKMEGRLIESEIPILEREFKRFLVLILLDIKPLAMIGPKIDEIWHQFILFTAQYGSFCQGAFGRFIHHQPNTPTTPVPPEAWTNFLTGYREHFGEIPRVWADGMDDDALAYFRGVPRSFPSKWSGWTG